MENTTEVTFITEAFNTTFDAIQDENTRVAIVAEITAQLKAVIEQNRKDALAAEATTAIVDLSEDMRSVMSELDIDVKQANRIAVSAFESVMRGKVQAATDRAIKAKYQAMNKGKQAVADELELEIQKGIMLKKLIS